MFTEERVMNDIDNKFLSLCFSLDSCDCNKRLAYYMWIELMTALQEYADIRSITWNDVWYISMAATEVIKSMKEGFVYGF